MKKLLALVSMALFSIGLVGCGSVTETISGTSGGLTVYLVVTTDSQSALNAINAQSATSGSSNAMVSSGDNHSGSQICNTNVSHGGHNYAFTVYVGGTIPDAVKSLLSSACSTLSTNNSIWGSTSGSSNSGNSSSTSNFSGSNSGNSFGSTPTPSSLPPGVALVPTTPGDGQCSAAGTLSDGSNYGQLAVSNASCSDADAVATAASGSNGGDFHSNGYSCKATQQGSGTEWSSYWTGTFYSYDCTNGNAQVAFNWQAAGSPT